MRKLYEKEGVQKLLASLLSILLGLTVGAIVVAIVGLIKSNIGVKGAWDGVRLSESMPRTLLTSMMSVAARAPSP